MSAATRVVVGAVFSAESGHLLVARRRAGTHLAGFWELPGGKIESGETPYEALCRELNEELGIEVKTASSFSQLTFSYPEKTVHLDAWLVESYQGVPCGNESQHIEWIHPRDLLDSRRYPFPPANAKLIQDLLQLLRLQ